MKALMISMLLGAILAWWLASADAKSMNPAGARADRMYDAAKRN